MIVTIAAIFYIVIGSMLSGALIGFSGKHPEKYKFDGRSLAILVPLTILFWPIFITLAFGMVLGEFVDKKDKECTPKT